MRDGAREGSDQTTATVTFSMPHDDVGCLHLGDGDIVEFGRAATCGIRLAFAPAADMAVPRIAGRLVTAGGRVFVEVADAPKRPSVQIHMEGRPVVSVGVGDAFSPAEDQFRVVIQGSQQMWPLDVRVHRRTGDTPEAGHDQSEAAEDPEVPATHTYDVPFTDLQERVLHAYLEPLTRGRLEPATHREVAAALSYHPNRVREVLYDIWALLFHTGVPLPDIGEKRVAVVEAVRLHRLLPPPGPKPLA
jgi:hypothetical protein